MKLMLIVFALSYQTSIDISNSLIIAMVITAAAMATAVLSVIAGKMKYMGCHLLPLSVGLEETRAAGRKEKCVFARI